MREVTFSVNCPRDLNKVYTMTIRLLQENDGSYLPAPCNGCENSNGLPQCSYCIETIFKMSLKDPTMQSYPEPITL